MDEAVGGHDGDRQVVVGRLAHLDDQPLDQVVGGQPLAGEARLNRVGGERAIGAFAVATTVEDQHRMDAACRLVFGEPVRQPLPRGLQIPARIAQQLRPAWITL